MPLPAVAALLLGALACSGHQPPPEAGGGAEAGPDPAPEAAGRAVTWASAPCTGRHYPRKILLQPGGTFHAWDLVSPCPPNARCVWSGIVERSGTWRLEDDVLHLVVERSGTAPGPFPFPDRLLRTQAGLQEPDGDCTYEEEAPAGPAP